MNPQIPNKTKTTAFRLFIALPLPDAVKAEIQLTQDQLRRELPEQCARWARPEQWHLTLKFLGDVDAARVGALTDAVGATCENVAPLKLRAETIGCFPDLRHPRVVWVGVRDAEEGLAGLAKAVEGATAAFSAQTREETFSGHITIARIKNLERPQAEVLAKLAHDLTQRVFGDWTAETVEVIRSELAADGAKHTCLARLPLHGGAERVGR